MQNFNAFNWEPVSQSLDELGYAVIKHILSEEECRTIAGWYVDPNRFRSRITMAKHGFGRGEYQYFNDPLPQSVARLRTEIYRGLASIANAWNTAMKIETRFPAQHADYTERCRQAGQHKPTPLLLRYQPGDYNCLHQDVYGEQVFPLQVAVLLSAPEGDFSGGEFVLTEQRPRMQSRVEVVPLRQGDGVVFPVRERPVKAARGVYRVNMRHGVSRIRSGERYTLGIIFHDAL